MRRPLKKESFETLKALKVPIRAIIDVGILTGTHELMAGFSDRPHLLIEPIVEWHETIRRKYGSAGIDFDLVAAAASDADGTMMMKTSTVRPGQPITHAALTDRKEGSDLREVAVRTVDTLLDERPRLRGPYLLKIDVDGVELQILRGAVGTLPRCSVVVIEANVRNFVERTDFLVSHGFELFDIVDPCYYDGRLRQFDLIFVNAQMVQARKLDMYKQAFDISKWAVYG